MYSMYILLCCTNCVMITKGKACHVIKNTKYIAHSMDLCSEVCTVQYTFVLKICVLFTLSADICSILCILYSCKSYSTINQENSLHFTLLLCQARRPMQVQKICVLHTKYYTSYVHNMQTIHYHVHMLS